jgi:hypothetical protein
VVPITEQALVRAVVKSIFLFHSQSRFYRSRLGVVLNFRFASCLIYVRIDVKQTPSISRHEKISNEPTKRQLVIRDQQNVFNFNHQGKSQR